MVQSSVQQYMAENPPVVEPMDRRPQPQENPLDSVISPYVDPKLSKANLMANAARDSAIFYARHPEAIEYMDEVEKVFNGLLEQGSPYDHEAVWSWFRGSPGNFEKFAEEHMKAEQEKIEAAKRDSTVDGGARPRGNVQVKDAHEATDEELEKGLEGVSF